MKAFFSALAAAALVGAPAGPSWAKQKNDAPPAQNEPEGPKPPSGPFDARKTERYHQRTRAFYLVRTERLREQVNGSVKQLRRAAAESHEALSPFPKRTRRVAGNLPLSETARADLEKLAATLETEVLARLKELKQSLAGPVKPPKDSSCAGAERRLGEAERAHAAAATGDAASSAVVALARAVETEMPRIEGELSKEADKRKLRSLSRELQRALGKVNSRLERELTSPEDPGEKGHKTKPKEKSEPDSTYGHDTKRPFPMLRAADRGAGAVARLDNFHMGQADAYRAAGAEPEALLALTSEARVHADSAARLLREAFSGLISEAAAAGKEAAQASLALCRSQAAFAELGLVKKKEKGKAKPKTESTPAQ